MLTWLAFIITPIVFLIVIIIGVKGQGGVATRIIAVIVLALCALGGYDHFTMKPARKAKQEAALLFEKQRAAHEIAQSMNYRIATHNGSISAADEIEDLIKTLPAPHRLPELHGIVLEGMQIIKAGIDLSERIKQEKQSTNRLVLSDDEQRRMEALLKETEEANKMLADNVKKFCAYLERPEKPLEPFKPHEIPKVCAVSAVKILVQD